MPIVLISESLLLTSTIKDGRTLRDRQLCGFCVRMNARKRTFKVATSVAGKQFRMVLGYWPLISVDEARAMAFEVLRECRAGRLPIKCTQTALPTVRESLVAYGAAKKLKASSVKRYDSIFRTHFGSWMERPVYDLGCQEFSEHSREFAQSKGNALVEVGRGIVTSLIKYVNAVHGLSIESPFNRLAAAGLLPERSQPRARVLQMDDLPAWRSAVDKLGELQRDFLLLTLYSGLRRNECRGLTRQQIDLTKGILSVPMTKNGKPHSLPITSMMREILERRCMGLEQDAELFKGVSAEHVHSMAIRQGSPRFMLHDLRKIVATVGEKLELGNAVLRRILNHTPPKNDVLHRHYISLPPDYARSGLERIQMEISRLQGERRTASKV